MRLNLRGYSRILGLSWAMVGHTVLHSWVIMDWFFSHNKMTCFKIVLCCHFHSVENKKTFGLKNVFRFIPFENKEGQTRKAEDDTISTRKKIRRAACLEDLDWLSNPFENLSEHKLLERFFWIKEIEMGKMSKWKSEP